MCLCDCYIVNVAQFIGNYCYFDRVQLFGGFALIYLLSIDDCGQMFTFGYRILIQQ